MSNKSSTTRSLPPAAVSKKHQSAKKKRSRPLVSVFDGASVVGRVYPSGPARSTGASAPVRAVVVTSPFRDPGSVTLSVRQAERLRRLVHKILLRRDRRAFWELYESEEPHLLRAATDLLHRSSEARSVTFDVWLDLWDLPPDAAKRIADPGAFLLDRVRSKCLNAKLRFEKRPPEHLTRADTELVRFIESLPAKTQQALEMTYFSGLDLRQASRKLHTTPEKLSRLLQDGLAAIRRQLLSSHKVRT